MKRGGIKITASSLFRKGWLLASVFKKPMLWLSPFSPNGERQFPLARAYLRFGIFLEREYVARLACEGNSLLISHFLKKIKHTLNIISIRLLNRDSFVPNKCSHEKIVAKQSRASGVIRYSYMFTHTRAVGGVSCTTFANNFLFDF